MQIDICGSFTHNNENWKHNYIPAGANMKSYSIFLHRGNTGTLPRHVSPLKTQDAENVRYQRLCAKLFHTCDMLGWAVLICNDRAWCEGDYI